MPLLSIIIPTFNSSKVLVKCLESIANQIFRDFEVLIIDGDSKDDTISIANEFVNKIPNLFILSEPDKGIYDAMNKGILKSKSDWLYFLGSDDSLHSTDTLLNMTQDLLVDHSLVYANVYRDYLEKPVYGEEFTIHKLSRKNICHQSMFFRRSVFDKVGRFDLNYKVMADYDLNIKIFLDDTLKTKYVDKVVANFSTGGLSSLGTHDKELIQIKRRFLKNRSFTNGYKMVLCFDILNINRGNNYLGFLERLYLNVRIYFYSFFTKFFKLSR